MGMAEAGSARVMWEQEQPGGKSLTQRGTLATPRCRIVSWIGSLDGVVYSDIKVGGKALYYTYTRFEERPIEPWLVVTGMYFSELYLEVFTGQTISGTSTQQTVLDIRYSIQLNSQKSGSIEIAKEIKLELGEAVRDVSS